MSESITAAQVKEHSTPETGLYIIIDNSVYSMASFADEHPGGAKILKRVGGKGMFCFSIAPIYFPISMPISVFFALFL
jgi:cytochrome b involved in lipid metabolism